MKWFEGAIPEAITLARSSKCIFLVYIEGPDEQSKVLSKTLDNPKISEKLTSSDFVAIRLNCNDSAAAQFSQIYPVVVVPSLYFIAIDGSLLSIAAGEKEATEISNEIDTNLQKHRQMLGQVSSFPSNSQSCNPETSPGTSNSVPTEMIVESEVSADIEVPATSSNSDITSGSSRSSSEAIMSAEENTQRNPNVDIAERVEYAKQLVAKKQAEKAKEEKEKEKKQEQERRKLGQEIQKSKTKRADEELKQLAKDRQRERQLEKEARDRVRQQIAQDKADRAAKRKFEREADEIKAKEANLEKMRLQAEAEKKANEKTTNVRLQLRLPDGAAHVLCFNADDTLSNVRAHVINNLTIPIRDFTFSQLIPRHQFTIEEEGQSLRQLELIPSAVLLILPSQSTSSSVVAAAALAPTTITTGVSGMFWSLLQPLFFIINFVKTFLFGVQSTQVSREERHEQDSISQPSSSTRAYRRPKPETGVRREGKMMRLARTDSDEDENTYNGNSTQQM